MAFLKEALELRNSLSAAAHLIHASSEGRFTITYCPGGLTREEVEGGEIESRGCFVCGAVIRERELEDTIALSTGYRRVG